MDPSRYLTRIGLDPDPSAYRGRDGIERLQHAHVTTVPFETLAITGDPFTAGSGPGITLEPSALYDKIVDRERGGFCYELNGLFTWLLAELGYDVDRLAAMVIGDEGDVQPPANHHTILVTLTEPVIVDVGLGTPTIRQPIPLDGTAVRDGTGTEWRVVDADRPDTDYLMQFRTDRNWSDRYYFDTTPRELGYFEASCEFLASAPESPFTGDPVVTLATDDGHLKLTPDTFHHQQTGEKSSRSVTKHEWHRILSSEFGLTI